MNDVSYDSIRTKNEEDRQNICYDVKNVHSIDELRSEMNRIGENISSVKTPWQSRVKSIQQIGCLINSNILNTQLCDEFIGLLFCHRDGICCQITELRSGITKEIFRMLSFLAIYIDEQTKNALYIKQKIQPFVDYIVPYILKQTKQTILVISHGSNICLRTIIKRIPLSKCIAHIITNTNVSQQKAICLRVRCMEYLQIMIDIQHYHSHYLTDDLVSRICEAVIHCISDPHPSVRYVARSCVWSLSKIYPNRQYAQYILSKLSAQNAKYAMSEKLQHSLLPPPVGTGHKIDRSRNKGLAVSHSVASIATHRQQQSSHAQTSKLGKPGNMGINNRPKSALPSRKHRLELLKRKKKEMASKLKKQNKEKDVVIFARRPATAHPQLRINGNGQSHQIGAPLRIKQNADIIQINHDNDNDHDNDDDDDDVMMGGLNENVEELNAHRTRKLAIMGNATRFSSKITPKQQQQSTNAVMIKKKLSPAMRIETNMKIDTNKNNENENDLSLILLLIGQNELNGINDLSKWLQSEYNENEYDTNDIEGILLALSGFIDCMTMNKGGNNVSNLCIESLVLCVNNLILYATKHLNIQTLVRLFSKFLRLFITDNCQQYMLNYDAFNSYFALLCKSLINKSYCLKNVIQCLSQSIIKPKQKLIWLHFLSVFCRQLQCAINQENEHWNEQLINYLFKLMTDCLFNACFADYHALFECDKCDIIVDIIKYIIYHHQNEYVKLFTSQLNDTMIETLSGIINNDDSIIQILQKYHSANHQSEQRTEYVYDHRKFTTPSHQNKKYQRIRKTQIESMTTPPLNMYMSTPAVIKKQKNNKYCNNNQNGSMTVPIHRYPSKQLQHKENESMNVNVPQSLHRFSSFNSMKDLNDEQLINVLLNKDANYIQTVFDEKNALKQLSHRINSDKSIFDQKCKDILFFVLDIMNGDQYMLHRNALRILQAICWFYPNVINENLQSTLVCIVNLFRKECPEESGELALDVITQFCKVANYEKCIHYLVSIIKNEIGEREQRNGGRKMFAALSVFDRVIVLCPIEWLRQNVDGFAKMLVAAYKYYRESMRSLIYLSIIFDGDTSFLSEHYKEQKIVQMMYKETDFTDWVKSHRQQMNNN